jgi:hypothetical protein
MKAVVVEIKNRFAALLCDDGRIVKVHNRNYAIGQVIEMNNRVSIRARKLMVWAASAAAAVCLCGIGVWAYTSPYSYVSLDVNPSIEFTLNRFDRVLTVTAVNDDAQEIVGELVLQNLNHKTIDTAIAKAVQELTDKGFFDGDEEGGVMIATSGKDLKKAETMAQRLQERVQEDLGDENVNVESVSVGLERVREAQKLGVTPGKLNLVEKLQASTGDTDSIDVEEWLDKPVREIMKAINENNAAGRAENKSDKAQDKAGKAQEQEEAKTQNQGAESQVQTETQNQKEKPENSPKQSSSSSKAPGNSDKEKPNENASDNANNSKDKTDESASDNGNSGNGNGNSKS